MAHLKHNPYLRTAVVKSQTFYKEPNPNWSNRFIYKWKHLFAHTNKHTSFHPKRIHLQFVVVGHNMSEQTTTQKTLIKLRNKSQFNVVLNILLLFKPKNFDKILIALQ